MGGAKRVKPDSEGYSRQDGGYGVQHAPSNCNMKSPCVAPDLLGRDELGHDCRRGSFDLHKG